MTISLNIGDCRAILKTLPSDSVHCVVTSPPYYGLRDYGTARWDGGDPACDHKPKRGTQGPTGQRADRRHTQGIIHKAVCGKCGAERGEDPQIGLERTPEAYVAELVAVFREVRRVLRKDGTLWLNLGDSYAAGGNGGHQHPGPVGEKSTLQGRKDRKTPSFHGHKDRGIAERVGERRKAPAGLKPKDLIGIPWMVAFALRADGWYLRQDIIWHKPRTMPESVGDRCTKAHEYLFLMAKGRRYHFDAEAIAEPAIYAGHTVRNVSARNEGLGAYGQTRGGFMTEKGLTAAETKNRRSVWSINPQPFTEAHFATFPPDLVEPCILAGCPVGGTVLDPFSGAGTTGMVADRLGRDAILIELNPAYAAMAQQRIEGDGGWYSDVQMEKTA